MIILFNYSMIMKNFIFIILIFKKVIIEVDEFTNNKDEIIKNFYSDDFLKKFVESNLAFTSILGIS